jgi:hypothetical protein
MMMLQADMMNWVPYDKDEPSIRQQENFFEVNGFVDMNDYDSMIVLFYFSFTSLTTVGFGDFHPHSDAERLFTAFGLLIGVSIFSYIMTEFIEMVERFNKRNNDCQGHELNKFFGLLKELNNKEQLNINMKRKIEQYFNHRWDNDRSNLFDMTDSSDLIS